MAKKFGGFTPQQQQTLLSKMGYTGPAQQDDINKFMMSSPKASSMMGKYAQMAKARVAGGPQIAMQVGGMTSNTTGGFDMSQPELQVEPAYDPTTGLPTAPAGLTEADYAPFLEQIAGGSTGAGAENNIPGITEMLSSNKLPEDPTDYEITGGSGNWTITYADGTTLKSPYRNRASIENEASNIANVLQQYKESDAYKAQSAAQDQYTQKIDQYKQYQSGQAGAGLEDTRATLNEAQRSLAQEQNLQGQYTAQLAGMAADDPQRDVIQGLIDEQQIKVTNAKAGLSQAQANVESVGMPSTTEMRATALEDPESMVTKADVVTVSEAQKAAGKVAKGAGQAGTSATAGTVAAAIAGDVVAPEVKDAATFTAEQTAQQVQDTLNKLTAVTGKPSAEALAEAQSMDPAQLAQLGVTVDQIQQAVTVQAPEARTIQEGELVAGTAVDFERARAETNFAAATGVPSSEATVQGQLTGLLEQFEGGETPPWAAGAMRAATATLAARGLGASSMAGQAVVQAAMESALPIAMADAQTRASFEAQNLSNRQQAAMFAAEQRSKFLGMEFDQEFQTRVQNAARIADVANINFTAEQQVALENARMAQTVDITNLNAKNAKTMADVAAMSQVEIANLNNRQQAAVQNAQSFLQMDMTNLSNQQQVAMFKAQGNIQSIITDASAANAAAQFNAASENQTNQFYDNLISQVAQFNNEQKNAMERFNAGEANAIAQFNAAQKNARDQFNASQALVVEQANAQWEQAITTMDNAAQNAANRDAAIVANNLTETTYNNMLQQERDAMDYAWRSAESALARENNLVVAGMQADSAEATAKGNAAGSIAAVAADYILNKTFGAI